jgi:hypothetical protein
MTGVIQNGQVTYAQALRSLDSQIEQLKSTITDFVGGAFTFQFTPKSQLDALPPTGSTFGPAAPVPLPVEKLAKAAEKPRYRMSRTIQTIPDLWRSGQLASRARNLLRSSMSFMARTGAQGLMLQLSVSSTQEGRL